MARDRTPASGGTPPPEERGRKQIKVNTSPSSGVGVSVCVGHESAALLQKPSKNYIYNTKLHICRVFGTWTDESVLIIISVYVAFSPNGPYVHLVFAFRILFGLILFCFVFCFKNHLIIRQTHPAGSPGGDECADVPHSHFCTFLLRSLVSCSSLWPLHPSTHCNLPSPPYPPPPT